jgi:hypothetical protein
MIPGVEALHAFKSASSAARVKSWYFYCIEVVSGLQQQ